jgi:biopolymer transport protein TolQ
MERAMVSAALRLQERLSLVATVVSVSPLIGILGTVIGLLDVFAGLDPQHKAALVPGVSSALITTIAALVVVIPSLAGYNTLMDRIRTMIARMDSFAFELSGVLGRQFVDHRKADEGLPALQSHGAPVMMSGTSDPNHHARA